MGLFDKVVGHAEVGGDVSIVNEYLFENEEIIQTFTFLRDSIVLTNLGIYVIDVQGLSGKKVEVKFFPKKTIKTISFESAGTLDFDVDIKIGVDNNLHQSCLACRARLGVVLPSRSRVRRDVGAVVTQA